MEILKDNYNKTTLSCEECGSVLYVNEDDYQEDNSGKFWECPLCKNKNYITHFSQLISKKYSPVRYPNDFISYYTGTDIDNKEINSWIESGFKYLYDNPDEPFHFTASGNSFVAVFNGADEYDVIVSKDYSDVMVDKNE